MTAPQNVGKPGEPERSLSEKWREYRKPGYYEEFDYAWTMTIDLDRCTRLRGMRDRVQGREQSAHRR